MSRVPEPLRHAAHDAWLEANGNRRLAVTILKKSPAAIGKHRWGRLIDRWGSGFNVRRGYQDLHRCGRRSHLSQQDLDRAVAILEEGYMFGCIQRGFPSMTFACEESQELRDILQRARISSSHLLVRIKRAAPEVVHRMQHVKAAFNKRQKDARKSACRWHLRQSPRFRKQVFWVDAKKMYIQASSMKAWLDSSQPIATVPDLRTEGRKVLHFYAMVNSCGGAVALKYVTGTSDHTPEHHYQVRCCNPPEHSCCSLWRTHVNFHAACQTSSG